MAGELLGSSTGGWHVLWMLLVSISDVALLHTATNCYWPELVIALHFVEAAFGGTGVVVVHWPCAGTEPCGGAPEMIVATQRIELPGVCVSFPPILHLTCPA